jgi:hypothetical protein
VDKLISIWEGGHKPFHSGIGVYVNGKLNVLQADPNHQYLVPIEYYNSNKIHIIKGTKPFDVHSAIEYTKSFQYSYLGATEAGLSEYIKIPTLQTQGKYCSQLCVDLWTQNGYEFKSDVIDPYSLELELKWNFKIIELPPC